MEPAEQKVHDDIDSYGWHVIKVGGDPSLPDFAYSIGLYKTFEHPELLIVGLPLDRMHQIINLVAEQIREGDRIVAGATSSAILENHACTFRAVPTSAYRDHVGWALWFYGHDEFPVLQIIWPDRDGRYPWQVEASSWLRTQQPVLADAGRAA